jgi:iron complex outermembrane receptor protein
VAVSVMTLEQIERTGVDSLESFAAGNPQLFVGRASNGSVAQITMRGIGSQATSIGVEQSTAVVLDGVYCGHGFFLNEGMMDISSIELLKWPQALYFGKNATAGVVSINTANPTDVFEAQLRADYEFEAEDTTIEEYISGPITDNFQGRLFVNAPDMSGGYFDNKAQSTDIGFFDIATGDLNVYNQAPNRGGQPGSEEYYVRGALLWPSSDPLSISLKASAFEKDDESNAWNYVPMACASGFTQPNPKIACKKNFDVYVPNTPSGVAGNLPNIKSDGSPYNLYESYAVTVDIEYAFEAMTLTSLTNYNTYRNGWGLSQNVPSPTSFVAATQDTTLDSWSNETRLQSDFGGDFDFMVGVSFAKY